jgi:murein endopeptidase
MRLAWLATLLVALGALGALVLGSAGGSAGVPAATPAPSAEPPDADARADGPAATTNAQATPASDATADRAAAPTAPIAWRRSIAVGLPHAGSLRRGVELPAEGRDYFTWDPVTKTVPNRAWRRWGTDRLVRVLVTTLRRYRAANPQAPRVGIGDLSRPRGGDFSARFGNLGHASHQNGLDADVYYPRDDRRERRPFRPALVDRVLAQELVDAFVAAGATHVFVGPRLGLQGPPAVVQPLVHHDDHLHLRIR